MKTPVAKKTKAPLTDAEKASKVAAKRTKFVELAEKRTGKAIAAIDIIGNLANKTNYAFTVEDVKAIVTAIDDASERVEALFTAALAGGSAKTASGFKLSPPAKSDVGAA